MFFVVRGALATIAIGVCSAWAAEPAAPAPAVQLLQTGWKSSAGNYAAAQRQYDQARHDAPQDVRIPFAMALVALQNHHLPEASKYLEEGLSSGKPLLPLRRTRIWLAVRLNDKPAATGRIQELARILAADEASANRADYQQSAGWLGAVIGYYTGPGKNQLKAADLAALDAELVTTLKGPLAVKFAEGKAGVEKQFLELQSELTPALAKSKAANEAKRADDRQKNDAALVDATDRRTRAEQEITSFRQENNADATEREFNQLNNQLRFLKAKRTSLEADLRSAESDARSSDSKDSDRGRIQSDAIERQLKILDSTVDADKGRLDTVSRSVQQIRDHCQPLVQVAQISRKQQIQLTTLKRQLDHPVSAYDNATTALEAKVKSISTYAGIDLEEEKTRILATYGAK